MKSYLATLAIMNSTNQRRVRMHPSVIFHDQLSAHWEHKYRKKSFQQRAAVLLGLIVDQDLSCQTWLDAGCGTGYLARLLAKHCRHVCGVDASPSMVRTAEHLRKNNCENNKITYQVISSIENLPFESSSFDGVLCSSVIEYLDNPEMCLREFSRILKDGGQLLLSFPNKHSILRITEELCFLFTTKFIGHPIPNHLEYMKFSKHSYSLPDFREALDKIQLKQEKVTFGGTGFKRQVDEIKYFGPLTMILSSKTN